MVNVHPHTWPLVAIMLMAALVEFCTIGRTIGSITIASNWIWSSWDHSMGMHYTYLAGVPADHAWSGEDDLPHGLRGHHHLSLGCLLFTFHFTWFDREPPTA